MGATAAVNPAAVPAPPARTAAGPAAPADEAHRFDRHLDAARQQHDEPKDAPAQETAEAKAPAEGEPAHASGRRQAEAPVAEPANPDAAALAAAMLALIGQAAPAKPAALATAMPQGAAKAVDGAQAAAAPPALLLLAGAAAAAAAASAGNTAAKSGMEVDPTALAPMLAKPAEQKEASLDPSALAATAPAPVSTGAPAVPAPAHALSVASPAGTPAFAQELGQHIAWLGNQDVKEARIRLHPEELGSLDVKVSLNHDRVDVSFAVQHPAAVHAVQQTLPQLDALLAHHGLALGQADVGQRQQQGDGARNGAEGAGSIGGPDAETGSVSAAPVTALGLLDTFA